MFSSVGGPLPKTFAVFCLTLLSFVPGTSGADGPQQPIAPPEAFTLMGDWEGQWQNPQRGHEVLRPELAAQLIYLDQGKCRIQFLPKLYSRARPYLEVNTQVQDSRIQWQGNGWRVDFQNGRCSGTGVLHGQQTQFELKHVVKLSPTLGQKPPADAVVLFDGSDFDQWSHSGGQAVTWRLLDGGVMETVTQYGEGGKTKGGELGGSIFSKQKFGDLRLHVEFRYAIEPGKTGQSRGNSGILLQGVGEVQILNSYGLPGYWDECGAIYKRQPPTVNAAGPPLQWQTYDIELRLPRDEPNANGKRRVACLSVRLNGHVIHNNVELPSAVRGGIVIGLQDHINPIQFRNIWVQHLAHSPRQSNT